MEKEKNKLSEKEISEIAKKTLEETGFLNQEKMEKEIEFLRRIREVLKHSKKTSLMLDERIKLLEKEE